MGNASVYRVEHTPSVWMDILGKSAENVGTEIEAEIITDMRWYRLLMSRKREYYCKGCLKYSSPYNYIKDGNIMISRAELLYAQFKVYFMEQLEKKLFGE